MLLYLWEDVKTITSYGFRKGGTRPKQHWRDQITKKTQMALESTPPPHLHLQKLSTGYFKQIENGENLKKSRTNPPPPPHTFKNIHNF